MSRMLIGYHNHIDSVINGETEFDGPAKEAGGVDFLLTHVDTQNCDTLDDACLQVRTAAEKIKSIGADFIVNFEGQNFVYDCKCKKDGFDWANRPDGTHLLNVPEQYIEAASSSGNCLGIMYDEFEHAIINRNISIRMSSKYKLDPGVFPLSDSKDPLIQGSLLSSQLKAYADDMKKKGAATLSGEHVWTVLFHKFAENGIIPNFKSQKESYSNIQFATAAGAAMQYKMPLWNCVDMWYRLTFPGHSAQEMYNNLRFAFLCGVDLVYVESVKVFYDKLENGAKVLNENGRKFTEFVKQYRGKERDYNVLDYKPEIGIIRYDDTFWGQGRLKWMWANMLFGNPAIKVRKESREWVQAFNIITHGETGNGGLSWGRLELRALRKHRSFASMNGAVVFDDKVKKELLESLKLCFLCGISISEETLNAVKSLVHDNGLVAVTKKRFLPDEIAGKAKGLISTIPDGKGTWIVTKSFKLPALKKQLSSYLGNKGEMTYRFGDKLLRMKISRDGESFELTN